MLWACGFRPVGHVLASHVNDGAAATELEVYVLQDVPLYLRGQSVGLAVADWPVTAQIKDARKQHVSSPLDPRPYDTTLHCHHLPWGLAAARPCFALQADKTTR